MQYGRAYVIVTYIILDYTKHTACMTSKKKNNIIQYFIWSYTINKLCYDLVNWAEFVKLILLNFVFCCILLDDNIYNAIENEWFISSPTLDPGQTCWRQTWDIT